MDFFFSVCEGYARIGLDYKNANGAFTRGGKANSRIHDASWEKIELGTFADQVLFYSSGLSSPPSSVMPT